MGRISGPISICQNPSSDCGYALDLTNLFMPKILGGVGAHEILHLGSTLFDLGLGLKTYPCYSALHNLHI